jgi:hypothetical protein
MKPLNTRVDRITSKSALKALREIGEEVEMSRQQTNAEAKRLDAAGVIIPQTTLGEFGDIIYSTAPKTK